MFWSCKVTTPWLRDQRVTWHVGWEHVMVKNTLPSLILMVLLQVEIKCIQFVKWPHKITCLNGHIISCWEPLKVSHHLAMFGAHWFNARRDITYLNLLRDLTRIRDWRIIWRYQIELLIVRHHPTRFVGHRHCDSEDIFSICHVIS